MPDANDMDLLRDYCARQAEPAFETLVRRHINLVYSAALRRTGNPAQAEEITQAVFIILARKAGCLRPDTVLPAWLHETTRHVSASFLRGEIRRRQREQEAYMQSTTESAADEMAWEQLSPLLDEAIGRLGAADRSVVVLRYFQNQSARDIAAALNIGEEAAKKRLSRAVEKLRRDFFKRGVNVSSATLSGAVLTHSIQAAPAGLAKTISTVALAKGAAASTSTLTLVKGALKIMAWTKAKTVMIAAAGILLATGTATVAVKEIVFGDVPDKYFLNLQSSRLYKLPPYIVIRKTHFKFYQERNGETVALVNQDRAIGRNMGLEAVIEYAYDFHDRTRMIMPLDLPNDAFDFIATVPNALPKLQGEIERQFGYVGHLETRDHSVLALRSVRKSKDLPPATPGLQTFAEWLRYYLGKTVVDETGGTGLSAEIVNQLHWDSTAPSDEGEPKLRQALRDQFGLELVETNMPIEMLIIEKVK